MLKVSFPDIDSAYLRAKVDAGYFTSVSEAIRDAVRKQREIEQSRLLAALEVGEKAIQEGRTQPFTRDLFDGIVSKGLKRARKGKVAVSLDVTPK